MSAFMTVLKEFAAAFKRDKRNDGTEFYTLRDDAPAWLQGDAGRTIMREIHEALDDRLPNDWVYETAASVADTLTGYDLDDADDARENLHEVADGAVDVYNADRSKWLADHLSNAALVDEACSELGCEPDADTFTRIGLGQYLAITRIGGAVIDAVEAEADSREEE